MLSSYSYSCIERRPSASGDQACRSTSMACATVRHPQRAALCEALHLARILRQSWPFHRGCALQLPTAKARKKGGQQWTLTIVRPRLLNIVEILTHRMHNSEVGLPIVAGAATGQTARRLMTHRAEPTLDA